MRPCSLAKPRLGTAGAKQICCHHASTQAECRALGAATCTLLEALCTQRGAAGFPGILCNPQQLYRRDKETPGPPFPIFFFFPVPSWESLASCN